MSLPAARGRTLAQRAVAGVRYLWPIMLERALPVRGRIRERAVQRASVGRPSATDHSVTIVGVYRQRNASRLAALLAQAPPGSQVVLWALDGPSPSLEAVTAGSGPGPKFELLNRLLDRATLSADGYLVVVDDDVCLARGDLGALVSVGARLGLDLFQPAHAWSSIFTYPLLLARPMTEGRATTFVEIGPLFVIGPRWRKQLLPFPEHHHMGWGLDVWWSSLREEGLVMGVVDRSRMVHLDPVGRSYDRSEEVARHEAQLETMGLGSVYDLMRSTKRWSTRTQRNNA